MNVLLSSPATIGYKFVMPPIVGGFAVIFGWALFNHPELVKWNGGDGPPPAYAKWVFLLFLVAIVFALRACTLLKKVWVEGDQLLVSNYRNTISIPLTEVALARVDYAQTYGNGVRIGPIVLSRGRPTCVLNLQHATEFGTTIRFIPDSREAIVALEERLSRPVGEGLEEYSQAAEREEENEEYFGRGTV